VKHLNFDENDMKNMTITLNLLKDGRWDLKGDALPVASDAVRWAITFFQRMKAAEDVKEEVPNEIEVSSSRKRK
jgi:hypothetical protein